MSPLKPIGHVAAMLAFACALTAVAESAERNLSTASPAVHYAAELDRRAAERFSSDAPGCIISVITNGREDFVRAYGMADIENRAPLDPNSRMGIASVSKQFTATAVLLLELDGALKLDAPISSYLGGLPAWSREVTVADLIYHMSGLRDYIMLQELRGYREQDYYSADELFALLARTKLEFEPGSRAYYSNSGYFLLGRIVERVSGMSLREFMESRIFAPLGMKHTFLQDDMSEDYDHRAFGYTADESGAPVKDPSTIEIVGDGGVVTTAHDLALWDANFYENRLGGGAQLIENMVRTASLRNGEETAHAAGLFVREYRGQTRIGHTGNFGGFKALVHRFPDLRTTINLLCNSDQTNPTAESRWITELVLGDHLTPPAPSAEKVDTAGDAPFEAFQGRIRDGAYYSAEIDAIWRLTCAEDGCNVEMPRGQSLLLESAGRDRLAPRGGWFEFLPHGNSRFELKYDDVRPIEFKRITDAHH